MASQTYPSNLSPRVPTEWRSSKFTTAICSAPDCGGNRAAFETCCNATIATFGPSFQSAGLRITTSGEDLQFLTCSIDSDTSNWNPLSTESSPYLEYQNCLLREGSEYFKCNMPNGETLDDCPVDMPTAPTGVGEVECASENRPNATSVLSGCCGPDLGVYGYGCYAWCSGSSELQQCVDDNQSRGSGPIIFCQNSTNSSEDTSSTDNEDSSDKASGSTATRATGMMTCLVYSMGAILLKETLL